MKNFCKTISSCITKSLHCTIIKHDGVEHAGYLAFLGLLALFPFLVLLTTLAGWIGQGELGAEFIKLLVNHLPPAAMEAIRPRIEELQAGPPKDLVTLAIFGTIWTASSALEGIRTVLNRAYHVSTPPAYWFRRLLSIGQLLVFTFVIMLGMLVLVLVPLAFHKLENLIGIDLNFKENPDLSNILIALSFMVLLFVVAQLYYILPNIKQSLRSVLPGAIVTVFLWTIAAWLFSMYLSKFDQVNLIYGSLGGIIATLLFFYINNIIFIFGAEFNYQLTLATGHAIEEKIHAKN